MSKMSDRQYLREEQYKDSSNLDVRIQLHARFSTNPYNLFLWIFDHLALSAHARILEVGCGPGHFWRANHYRIPKGWEITLSDFSPGMVQEVRQNLSQGEHPFTFSVLDAQQLPFEAEMFDAVIANHMLYHVPNRPAAFAEIRRVLRPGGRLFATTMGRDYMKELYELRRKSNPGAVQDDNRIVDAFGLENGAQQLAPWFSGVTLDKYEDSLRVTEAEPLVAYMMSSTFRGVMTPEQLARFRAWAEREIATHGAIHISKDTGLFIAVKGEAAQVDLERNLNKEVQAIWDQNAVFWDARMGEGNAFQNTLVGPSTDRLLRLQTGEEVLDIACGNGVSSRRLAKAGAKVVAFDFSPQFIELAKGRDAGSANLVEYHVIDATDEAQMLALGGGRFDAAICNMAIMDMSSLEPMMSALGKVLKPGGRFVFSVMHPCFNGSGVKLTVEQDDAGGELHTVYSVKVSRYGDAGPEKGLGMVGQPAAQYYFHRTLSELFNTCFQAGFVLDGMEEPSFGENTDANRPLSWLNFKGIPPALVVRMRLSWFKSLLT